MFVLSSQIPDTEKTCIRFLTRRVFDVGDIQPVPVKVYDYYEPGRYKFLRTYC